jgi:histone H3/H4
MYYGADMTMTKLAAKKILKESGAKRVSDSAAIELCKIVNKFSYGIAAKAVKLAAHAKRETVKKEDVSLAK